ncbi:hypothetical protein [Synechococcus sp. 1G10]|uniref:hypothetical protein n=1 Tax=Synechococcus sp. 1G10 TaxID=2025605 RepID=UPI000B982D3D|nr:hypothetical protein [Synechococcus sp. 1G10]
MNRLALLTLTASLLVSGGAGGAVAAERCTFLQPIGGTGTTPIVTKRVQRPRLSPLGMVLGQTNWNTDFSVDQPYSNFKFFFTAVSSDAAAKYPVEGFMKFNDGSSLQVINELMTPPIGTGRMFGPFPAIAGKQASQMNFKVGSSSDPDSTGFSYRISVQGCR